MVDSSGQAMNSGGPVAVTAIAEDEAGNAATGGGGTWWNGNLEITSPGSPLYSMDQSGSGTISVTAAAATQWTATAQAPWIHIVSGASGSGSGSISYTFDANQTGSPQAACISIDDTTDIASHQSQFAYCLQIQQDSIAYSPAAFNFYAGGGTGTVNVTGSGAWSPWDPDGWVHITSAGPGSGNGSFSFSVDPNTTGVSQTSTIYLTGQYGTVVITQSGQYAPAITSVSPNGGPVGTAVTIAGTNFGATQGASTVTFGGINAGTAASWSATSITVAVPALAVTGPVVVTVNGVPSNGAAFTVVPVITTVSPISGAAGTQVVISGSGFGLAQGAGLVWLGSTPGTVVSWSSNQITATVASNSTTGTVLVSQGGTWSNSLPFTVATPTISSITPTTGIPGTTVVTLSGSGFGASQGTGQVWLGTANGVVQSWSDTQVVAQVAPGSTSGNAAILQNGVWSNPVSFTVDSLLITSVTPTSGAAGTQVTIAGSGFGASQGTGTLVLGGVMTTATTWTDTQITASVAAAALTGVVRVEQNGAWSNALPFTVPGGVAAGLVPHLINMAVGDTHTIQALNSSNQSITGLAWTSSDPTIVSLSTDDPPVLTAVAVGHVTISAGGASADVTVSPTLSPGTLLWSNPGDGSGVYKIVPAVPSSTGVADVFAFQNGGTVQAITSDGTTAWTAQAPARNSIPDFQGGLIVSTPNSDGYSYSVQKLDGITGQPYPAYTATVPASVVYPDGTVLVADTNSSSTGTVVGIDPITGTQKFSVTISTFDTPYLGVQPIIAGDGYAYIPHLVQTASPYYWSMMVTILRVNSSGAYDDIPIYNFLGAPEDYIPFYTITNADQGVLVSWSACETPNLPDLCQDVTHVATVSNTGVTMVNSPQVPGLSGPVVPVLQAQDGSFVGTASGNQNSMIAFDQSGNLRWSVAGSWQPQIATDDGGVIATQLDSNNNPIATVTFDQNGNATGQMGSLPIQSWTGNTYQVGSVDLVWWTAADIALSFNPLVGGNPSHNGTAVRYVDNPTFIPGLLTSYDLPPSVANITEPLNQERLDLFQYYSNLSSAISPTQVAFYPLLLQHATPSRFLGALGLTNAIVAYLDHGLVVKNDPSARGLCFWNWCLMPTAVAPEFCFEGNPGKFAGGDGYYACLNNGFTPRAKVVFLAACGIDAKFLAGWHLAPQGQALIVPQYAPGNVQEDLNLTFASQEWQVMLLALGNGSTVAQAVAQGTAQAVRDGANYTWITAPGGDGSVNFKAKQAQ